MEDNEYIATAKFKEDTAKKLNCKDTEAKDVNWWNWSIYWDFS